jgi:hypothetical protein
VVLAVLNRHHLPFLEPWMQHTQRKYTIADRLTDLGPGARERWRPYFERAGLSYPPQKLLLLGLKQEKRLEVYGSGSDGGWKFIRSLPVRRASGHLGPKMKEGDLQVPEGFYRVESLNPNSRFHLALRVNYPNSFDRDQAAAEGRDNLGGDIMIHGGEASVGCLAMGDEAAEDLFILAAERWPQEVEILLCPMDFRLVTEVPAAKPEWMKPVYRQLAAQIARLPLPSPAVTGSSGTASGMLAG